MLKEEVHQFVEDILGATKPSSTFSSAVMAALPAIVGNTVAKSSAAVGANVANKAAGKTGLLSPAWGMWAGLFGMIYGMNIASQHVGATINKNLFYKFSKVASFVTFCLISIAMALFFIGNATIRFYILVGSAVYTFLMVTLTVYVAVRQRKIDQKQKADGTAPKVNFLILKPAEPDAFRKAISSAIFCSWLWLLFLANVNLAWATLAVSVLVMFVVGSLRRRAAGSCTTIPEQMRFQSGDFWNQYFSIYVYLHVGRSFGSKSASV